MSSDPTGTFPSFDDLFSNLNHFILRLVGLHQAGNLDSWETLEREVKGYFTPERLEEMESLVPGWQKMASYSDGITLVHVMCVFLGLFMLPEFRVLSSDQQQLAKWVILFHDVSKKFTTGAGEKDRTHAFRSAVIAAQQLPRTGFAATPAYDDLIDSWSSLTHSATRLSADHLELLQDNRRLPDILAGIENLFGKDTPTALIIQSVLLHMSLNVVRDWPQAAPLTEDEIKRYIDLDLLPLLRVMMLADNEGWSLFDPDIRAQQRKDTLQAFQRIKKSLLR